MWINRQIRPALFVAVIALLLGPGTAPGQAVLKGQVKLPDKSEAIMAMVKLAVSDSVTLVRYTRTDLQGRWELGSIKPGEYVLQVAYLGLETWKQRIHMSGTDTLIFDISLEELPLTLRVVEISATRIGIVERGDTLHYDLSYYLDSTEHNLKDVLNRLPDMRVESDGSIQYKGKRVNIALVEGRDLFGQLHKAMTEGIAADKVKGVQIIRAYKTGAEQQAGELSDKIAVNVELTDEARRQLNGEAGFDTDVRRFVEANATLYQSGSKYGYSFIARGKNTGQSTISGADIVALMDFEEGAGPKGIRQGTAELISPLLVPRPDAQSSLDLLSAANLDISWSARWKSQLNVQYISADRKSENILFRLYLQDAAVFTGIRSGRHNARMYQASVKNDYHDRGRWLKQRLLVTTNRLPVTANTIGVLAGQPLENRFDQDARQVQVKALLEGGMSVDSQRMMLGRLSYVSQDKSDLLRLQSPDRLFGAGDSSLRQRNDVRDAQVTGELSFRQPVNADQLTTTVGYVHTSYRLEAATLPGQATGAWDLHGAMQDAGFFGAVALGRQGKRRYRAGAKATASYRTFPAEPAKRYRYLLTDLNGGYYHDFSPVQSLYVNAGYTTSPTPFAQLWRYRRIRDANNVYLENLDSSFLQQEAYASLIYSRITQDNSRSLLLTQTASFKKNDVLYQAIPSDNYLIYQSLLAPSVTQWSTLARMGYRLKPLAVTTGATIRYTFKTGFAILSEQLVRVRNHDADLTLSLSYNGVKRLNVMLTHTYLRTGQRYGALDAFRFYDNRTGAAATYRHKNWRADVSASFRRQQFAAAPNRYWILDFELEHRLNKLPIRLRLTGRNLLSLQGNTMILPDFGANYTGFSSFQTIGGQLMAGAAYVF